MPNPDAGHPTRDADIVSPNRILRNFASRVSSASLEHLLRLVTLAWSARILGAEAFGQYSFAFGFQVLFVVVGDFGLGLYGARRIGAGEAPRAIVAKVLSLKLLLGVAAFVVMQLSAVVLGLSPTGRTLFLVLGIPVMVNLSTFSWIFVGIEEMRPIALLTSLRGVFTLALVMLAVTAPEHVVRLALIEAGVGALAALVLLQRAGHALGGGWLRLDVAGWGGALSAAAPLGLSRVLRQNAVFLPLFLLGILASERDIGLYRVARLAPSFLAMVVLHWTTALYPSVSRLYVADRPRLARFLSRAWKVAMAAVTSMAVVGFAVGPALLARFAGGEFADAGSTLGILILGSVFLVAAMTLAEAMPACSLSGSYLGVMALRVVVVAGGGVVLIPRFGGVGAALAMLIAEAAASVASIALFRRGVGQLVVWPALWRMGVAASVASVAVWGFGESAQIGPTVVAAVFGVGVFWGTFVFVLRGVNLDEIRRLVAARAAAQATAGWRV